MSHFSKLFTRVLNNRLSKWAENYNVYIEAQAGYRKKMGTVDNIFVLNGLINHFLSLNKKMYIALIDFSKAYDYVVRDVLWYKLIQFEVRGKILNVIQSMYSNIKLKVKCNNDTSDSYSHAYGVAQGDCLSSFLFSLYLNDIEQTLEVKGFDGISIDMFKLFVLLYADDIALLSETKEGLQNGLDLLGEYCKTSKLTINTNKSKIMIFRKGGRYQNDLQFRYNGETLDIVSTFNYLGIVLSSGGSFTQACNTLAGQAMKAYFKLKCYLHKFTNIKVSHQIELFDKLVLPILNYGAETWGYNIATKIERVHLLFCKQLLGVKTQTQNNFIYGELGRLPLRLNRLVIIIKYWFKILRCENKKYIKYTYLFMLNDMNISPNKVSWATQVKDILETHGFNYVWANQGVENVNIFLKVLKQRVRDIYYQEWNGQINNSTRANTYKLFSDLDFKMYLDTITIQKYRIALTKLRVSSHRLEIEVGRWHKPQPIPVNERKCKLCAKLEDEFHFILECPLYKQLRSTYIKPYFYNRPNVLKFTELISSTNSKIIQNVSIYTFKAFELRKLSLMQNDVY
jgi:hypothetical protein